MVRGSGGAHAAPPQVAPGWGPIAGLHRPGARAARRVTAYRLTHTAGSPTAGTNPSAAACGGDPLTVVVTPALESVARDAWQLPRPPPVPAVCRVCPVR